MRPKDLFLKVLPTETKVAFQKLQQFSYLKNSNWYLAGGTALALQVGHRQSVDLDFFTLDADFDRSVLERKLLKLNEWSTTFQEEGTLYGELSGAKVSFIANPSFAPSNERVQVGNIPLLLPKDIAIMKIMAISQRGKKRDFIDLFWYCSQSKEAESLDMLILRTIAQYQMQESHGIHLLKSLVYFDDAETDPLPKVNFSVQWENIRHYFKQEVARILQRKAPMRLV